MLSRININVLKINKLWYEYRNHTVYVASAKIRGWLSTQIIQMFIVQKNRKLDEVVSYVRL